MTINLYQAAVLIFVAGGFYFTTRASFKSTTKDIDGLGAELRREISTVAGELRREASDFRCSVSKDLSGIGMKVKSIDDRENRRYHNVSLAIVLAAPQENEDKIVGFLKE